MAALSTMNHSPDTHTYEEVLADCSIDHDVMLLKSGFVGFNRFFQDVEDTVARIDKWQKATRNQKERISVEVRQCRERRHDRMQLSCRPYHVTVERCVGECIVIDGTTDPHMCLLDSSDYRPINVY